MRRLILCAVVLCCFALLVGTASADQMSYSLTGPGLIASGYFYGSPSGPGQWLVTGATGFVNGTAVTGVWPTSNSGNIFNFNNLYYWPGPPNVDNLGIVVTLQNGDLVNFCYDSPNCAQPGEYAALLWDPSSGTSFLDADSVSFGQPVPEPGTMILMGTGLLSVFGIMRRRF